MNALVAHAGGWDELLYFLAPIVLYLLIRPLFGRRSEQEEPNDSERTDEGNAP